MQDERRSMASTPYLRRKDYFFGVEKQEGKDFLIARGCS